MRKLIRVKESGDQIPREKLKKSIDKAVEAFSSYLTSCFAPEKPARTMHSMLGPVGKLLSLLETGRAYTEDEIVGFAARVHEQTAHPSKKLTTEALDKIKTGVSELLSIRESVPRREWPRVISSVRYGVYQRVLEDFLEKESQVGQEHGGD